MVLWRACQASVYKLSCSLKMQRSQKILDAGKGCESVLLRQLQTGPQHIGAPHFMVIIGHIHNANTVFPCDLKFGANQPATFSTHKEQSEVGIPDVAFCTKVGGNGNLRGYLHQRKPKSYGFDKQSAFTLMSSCLRHGVSQLNSSYGEKRRAFGSEQSKEAISGTEKKEKEMITVTFVDKEGDERVVKVPIGMSILEAAHQNDIELEGACEGSLACSTCHVIVMDEDYYENLPEPTDEENDMLDLAFGLTETSRLGCQVIARPELDGIRLALPVATRNFAVDGHVPKPH